MDIGYLLNLQDFRNLYGEYFTAFFQKMTYFGELSTTLLIIAALYWCVSKKYGTYLLVGFHMNRLVNGFLKITACVYRPWIRDLRVVPDETALKTATGYSFPSGHSTNGGVIFGGAAMDKEFSTGFRILMLIGSVLVAFSRNYLGVHTPQDVVIGLGASLIVMAAAYRISKVLEKNPSWDVRVAAILIIVAILVTVYAFLKPYPEDYDEAGKLIVDGSKMARDTLKAVGYTLGFTIGWIMERRLVKFETGVDFRLGLTRLVGGFLGFYMVNQILSVWITSVLPVQISTTLNCMLIMFYIVFLWPLLYTRIEARMKNKSVPASGSAEANKA